MFRPGFLAATMRFCRPVCGLDAAAPPVLRYLALVPATRYAKL